MLDSGMFDRLLAPHQERIYALMRIVLGLLFAVHGAQKVFGVLGGKVPAFGTQMWFGGVIELVAGLLVALGLFTRCAAFLSSGTMAVAYTQFHWKLQLGAAFFPVVNKGELALVYAFVFLYIAAHGPGIASLDARRR
jgi:putative oxidoreductase